MKRTRKLFNEFGGWSASQTIAGNFFVACVKRGKYQGKRFGRRTWLWHGSVFCNGKFVWQGRVAKSVSFSSLLEIGKQHVEQRKANK